MPLKLLRRARPEHHRQPVDAAAFGIVEKPLSGWERLGNNAGVRKLALLVVLALIWEGYARWLNNPLLFPTFTATLSAFADAIASGVLPGRALTSLRVLLTGYAIGILCAAVLTTIAISTRIGTDLLELLTSMFNPLPAIALLPLALIWFGLGYGSIVFVIVHSVLWAVALNTHSGFLSVSNTLRMVGRNYGLSGLRYVGAILIPAAFPEHPHRPQDRLGVRVAHADRRGARLRRVVGIGRPRLVHLREQESARDSGGVRRPLHRDPDRARRRERHFPDGRGPDRPPLGDAKLMTDRLPTANP